MTIIKNNGCIKISCCECGLTHLWTFKIKRGKTIEDDSVEIAFHLTGPSLKNEQSRQEAERGSIGENPAASFI